MASPEEIKTFILQKAEPSLFQNRLKWNILDWKLEDWKSAFQEDKFEFRCGKNSPSQNPQWERNTEVVSGDFNYFLKEAQNQENWLYFDYKQLNTWLTNITKLREDIDWSPLGFPEIKPEDCTIWIGTKGAHTPCHMDCYGFNLVYQIYGKKMWLLFPPEENLKPTRVPYEESSIYSKLNFFSPKIESFKGFSNKCRKVELSPGDVLLVPHKWWHYVENLDTSISINVWIPLPGDDEERLKESIVQYTVKQMADIMTEETRKVILNPNMDELLLINDTKHFFNTINTCKKLCKRFPRKKMVDEDDRKILHCNFGVEIPVMPKGNFMELINHQICRFDKTQLFEENEQEEFVKLVQAFTNPEVINLITNSLLKTTLQCLEVLVGSSVLWTLQCNS